MVENSLSFLTVFNVKCKLEAGILQHVTLHECNTFGTSFEAFEVCVRVVSSSFLFNNLDS